MSSIGASWPMPPGRSISSADRSRGWRCSAAAPRDHVLLCAAHHIAVDYWSLVLLMGELEQLYADALAGRGSSLPALARQYVDHVRWQREYLQSPEGLALCEHWQRRLGDDLPRLNLPTDRPRPQVAELSRSDPPV